MQSIKTKRELGELMETWCRGTNILNLEDDNVKLYNP